MQKDLNTTLLERLPSLIEQVVPESVIHRLIVPLQHSLSRSLTTSIVLVVELQIS